VKRVRGVLVALALAPLRAYSRFISPALPRRCKYEPTCSAYAEQAIRELGVARGGILALWRLARCNPFSHGGYDPVEARTIFRPSAASGVDPADPYARTTEGTTAP
jgi:putative membrane protein insertion efficiency factor